MRIDKTYSELWELVNTHKDKDVIFSATMAIDALQKLQNENERYEKALEFYAFETASLNEDGTVAKKALGYSY